jgi:hypothetical protein
VSATPGDLASYKVHTLPFEEWVDIDTLLHRSSLTSGEFDYALRPLCPECGQECELEYEMVEEGTEVISALVCHVCQELWEADDPKDEA